MTAQADRSLSDFWRTDRSDDRALEMLSVLRGADNLIGLMGSALRARWSGATLPDGTHLSYTDLAAQIVALDYSPLSGQEAPFLGSKVDEVIGYAAHEGGHCVWTEPDKPGTIQSHVVANLSMLPRSFQQDWREGERHKVEDGDGGWVNPVLVQLCRIQNILEDAYIDYHIAGTWEVLGEYVRTSRRRLAEKTPIDLAAIAATAKPDRNAAMNVWISVVLYDYDVPTKMLTKMRRAMTALLALTESAIAEDDGTERQRMAVNAARILWAEFPTETAPLPTLPPQGDAAENAGQGQSGPSMPQSGGSTGADDDEDDSDPDADDAEGDDEGDGGTGSGADGGGDEDDTDDAADAAGSGGASGSEPDDDDGDGAGGGDDDSEADEAEGDDPATSGDPTDGDDDGDPDAGDDAIDDLARQLASVLNQRAANLKDADDAEGQPEGAGDGAGELGNLDDYDEREVEEVPPELLAAIMEALESEYEDIHESVAEVLAEPPEKVAAGVKRAVYDQQAAEEVTRSVGTEIAQIRRVFDREQQAATGYLRGQSRGKIDRRALHKVGVGNMNVRKRRTIAKTPDMAVGLLLDVSQSMDAHRRVVLETGAVFAEGLIHKRGVNFAAWTYTGGRGEVKLTRICDRAMGKLCLAEIETSGGTPTGAAIAGCKVLMGRMPEPIKVLIHFTDGMPDARHHATLAVNACRDAGIGVYTIAVPPSGVFAAGAPADLAGALRDQYGEGNYEVIHGVEDLPNAVARFLQRLAQQ